jgi:hypothetical protein
MNGHQADPLKAKDLFALAAATRDRNAADLDEVLDHRLRSACEQRQPDPKGLQAKVA